MEQFQIETAQNITISQNAAHLGDRMVAFLIDTFVVISYIILSIVLLLSLDIEMNDAWAIYMVLNLPALLYYLLFETLMNGQSIGKKLMKIRVVKLDGSKPTFSSYIIRWVLRILDVTLSSGGVAVLTILIRGNGQRVGDIAAGTTVISEKQKVFLRDTLLRELPEDYKPSFPQVTVFKDREMQTIKELFDVSKRKGDHNVILSLSNQIKKVTHISTDLKPVDFVDMVIKDYNYYTQNM
ncbi:RDD family protein [Cytophaga sp. FL35]|uniref:RDD family protein n=1 Tax=Cytophaga sp. FL35 TaxID=1904456 RepID=UPI001653805E|nr:RDD family protein [Cytophaga sp. FL35]MBC6999976.1 RDD family protein [Cytophaga sp. FL35]